MATTPVVRITSLPLVRPDLPDFDELEAQFREVLSNGRVTNFGKYVREFEARTGEYLGAQTVTVSSGTMGLLLTLQALDIRPGDHVILPSFTFMATAQAIVHLGGVPVFADVEPDLTLSCADLEQLLAQHADVAAVMPVHTYGLPCHVDKISDIVTEASARRRKPIKIVYDGAHAFGSAIGDRRVGAFGDAEVFSLSVTKLLVSIEGGLVSTRDTALADRLRKMRNYGIDNPYDAGLPGLNGKMSELHAIVGLTNLARLPQLIDARAHMAVAYADRIEERTGFKAFRAPEGVTHTFKDFTILLPPEWRNHRQHLIEQMAASGIETRAYFSPPVHKQTFFQRYADRPLPVTEELAGRVLTLPFFTSITKDEMNFVVDALCNAQSALASSVA